MKFLIIFLIIGGLLCINFANNSFGYNVEYQIFGKQFSENPLVCTYEPKMDDDPDLKQWGADRLSESARLAVQDWQSALQQYENRISKDNWRIDYKSISDKNISPKDCNIIIQFNSIPKDENEWYRTLGVTYRNYDNNGTKLIKIYYKDVKICQTQDDRYIYHSPCYGKDVLTSEKLRTTITHEMGHALGLGHYQADDPKVNQIWAKGGADAESIMAVFSHENSKLMKIKPIDVEKIKSIYTPNGFKSASNPSEPSKIEPELTLVPSWIKNNAGWWADGNLDDVTFVEGVQYLIKNQIIKVGNISQSTDKDNIIPKWVKNNAGWWADGSISDEDFLKGIEYLVQKRIIKTS
ncbi:MAG: hypothetical protein ACE5RF_03635 [Nitrosarchaeum sp.]